MSDRYILDAKGNPQKCDDWKQWAQWREEVDKTDGKRVAFTKIGRSRISTVFLGYDHQYDPGGPPLLYETLVFGGPLADEMDRYSTRAEAAAGHEAMVERVMAAGDRP